jgi:YVTN family beta-propeller protein
MPARFQRFQARSAESLCRRSGNSGHGLSLLAAGAICVAAIAPRTAQAQSVAATVAAGSEPYAVEVNTVTNKVYVANYASGSVTVVDGATNAATSVAVGTNPCSIGANWVTNRIYVANLNSQDVTVIDGATNSTRSVPMGDNPRAISVNTATNMIYVSNTGTNAVAVIDGTTNETTSVPVGAGPTGIAVNTATNKVYVSNSVADSGTVTVIDGATHATTTVPVGSYPSAIAANTATDKIYVANVQSGTVTVIDGATNATATVPVGSQPLAIAVNSVTNKVYVANYGDASGGTGNVTVIDGSTNTTATVAAGNRPAAIAVNTVTNKVYVTDSVSNVTVIDGATNATTPVPVGSGPAAVAVDPVTNMIYVADQGGNAGAVTVINGSASSLAAPSARLVNLSARAQVGTAGSVLIPGFVIGGSGTETLLIRGAGPGLSQFGVPGVLARPSLSLFDATGSLIASNTGWGTNSNPAQVAAMSARVGAFAFAPGSADCALVANLPSGAYTVQVSGANNTTGVALAEVYEVSSAGTRLINISTRAEVGNGGNIIINGFVVSGNGAEVMLVRADGPALAQFGVPGALAQPSLSVFDGSGNLVASNTGWGHNFEEDLTAGFAAAVGAFPLAPGSADSAQFVNVPAGAYSMQVSGANSTSGIVLAEAFEAQ